MANKSQRNRKRSALNAKAKERKANRRRAAPSLELNNRAGVMPPTRGGAWFKAVPDVGQIDWKNRKNN